MTGVTTTGGVGDTKRHIGKHDKWLSAVAKAFGQSTLKDTYDRLCATRTPSAKKKYGPARAGAKQVKAMERLESSGPTLNSAEATIFRALSARANYLAQDRPDIAFATKELCREFCQPTKRSYERLKCVNAVKRSTWRPEWGAVHVNSAKSIRTNTCNSSL